jgi:hypothetical protein
MLLIDERFTRPEFDQRLRWFNPPSKWRIDRERTCLTVEPDAGTDFWRKTHSGLESDTGHLLYAEVQGDIILTTCVRFHPVHRYDQAGLMLRVDGEHWLKTSVEYDLDEPAKLGAVITYGGYSDWSVQPFTGTANEVWLRISTEHGDCLVEHSPDGTAWHMLRLAHLNAGAQVQCGLYACSPTGGGFRAEFDFLKMEGGQAPGV